MEFLLRRLKVPFGCTTELSHKGQEFLTLLFSLHDKDQDGALCPEELNSLFSKCITPPWGEEYKYMVATNEMVISRIVEKWCIPSLIRNFGFLLMIASLLDFSVVFQIVAYYKKT